MRILVDTNVLVRSIERNHPLMRTARQALRSLVLRKQGSGQPDLEEVSNATQ